MVGYSCRKYYRYMDTWILCANRPLVYCPSFRRKDIIATDDPNEVEKSTTESHSAFND